MIPQLIQKFAATLTLTLILALTPLLAAGGVITAITIWTATVCYAVGAASYRVLWPGRNA